MSTQNGTDIILFVEGERFAALTANDFSPSQSSRETTNKDSAGWKQFEYGLREASMNATGLILASVKNKLAYTEDLTNPMWVYSGDPYTGVKSVGPFGLKNASVIQLGTEETVTQTSVSITGAYVFSLWVKAGVDFSVYINSDLTPITATGAWQFVAVPFTAVGATAVGIIGDVLMGGEIELYGPQLEQGTNSTTYQPSGKQWDYFLDAIRNKTKLTCYITNQQTIMLTCEALITNFSIATPQEDNAQITADFAIDGMVEVDEIP